MLTCACHSLRIECRKLEDCKCPKTGPGSEFGGSCFDNKCLCGKKNEKIANVAKGFSKPVLEGMAIVGKAAEKVLGVRLSPSHRSPPHTCPLPARECETHERRRMESSYAFVYPIANKAVQQRFWLPCFISFEDLADCLL